MKSTEYANNLDQDTGYNDSSLHKYVLLDV